MKIQLYLDNGANIHSCRDSGWIDPVDEFGLNEGEWETLTDEEKWEYASDWANNYIDIGWNEE